MSNGKWKISDVLKTLKNAVVAIIQGEFLLRLNIGKYFAHILFTFAMMAVVIWLSLAMESTMAKEQKLKSDIEELEIINSQKIFETVTLEKRSEVRKNLARLGSNVTEPETNAIVLR